MMLVVVIINALPFLVVGGLVVFLALTAGGLGRTVGSMLDANRPADKGEGPVAPGPAAPGPADN